MAKYKVDYKKIYEVLDGKKGQVITASGLAFALGIDRVYGGTMAKLVREGRLSPMPLKGYYRAA